MPSPSDSPPIVYVETSWLVALVLPHDRHHRDALALLAAANRDECEVRIPYGCFLEALSRARGELDRRPTDIENLRGLLANAFANGADDLADAVNGLNTPAVRAYFQRRPDPLLDALEANPKIRKLHDARSELKMMATLRPLVRFEGEDRFDLYALASITSDRETTDMTQPAVFCTIDRGEFMPSKKLRAKMPSGVYERWCLYWWDGFDWRSAVAAWSPRRFAARGSSPPSGAAG